MLIQSYATETQKTLYASQAPLLEQNPGAEPIPPAPLPPTVSCEKYIVLQNDSILFGIIQLVGDQYEITTKTGTLVFPQSQVTQIAESLQQIYAVRARQVFINDLEGRCNLIQWCLQYELIDETVEQLNLLKQYEPGHALVAVFERRLNLLKSKQNGTAVLDSGISNALATPESHVTYAELQRFGETISPDAFDVFRKKVQPILQKNCMTAGCHGPDSVTAYRLLRISPKMARGEILQNLYATVQQLDYQHPEKSPFLRKPVTPHSSDARRIFLNQDYATYQVFIAWTYLVTQNRYVIPRAVLIPPPASKPIYTPTQRGLIRISATTQISNGPWNMVGVDASLYPQTLYPEDYAVHNPYANVTKTNRNSAPPVKLLLPKESEVTPAIASTPTVVPTSSESNLETEANQTQPATSAEEISEKDTPNKTPSKQGEVDWEAVRRSINQTLGDVPENDTQENTDTATPDSESHSVPATEVSTDSDATLQALEDYYGATNTDITPKRYSPGQSSIGRVYRPGQSSAENLRRANPNMGMTSSPNRIPAPSSPTSLLYGRDTVERGAGSYQYDPNAPVTSQNTSRGTLQWEQMLELQGGSKSLQKQETP